MTVQRVIRLRLGPSTEQAGIMRTTLVQHTACFNAVAAYGWEHGEKNGVNLHHETYYSLRRQFPDLPAQLVVAARVRATEAVKSALALKKKGRKVSGPKAILAPIRYDARSYHIRPESATVGLSTVAGRQWMGFKLDQHALALLDQAEGFDSADLILRDGRFHLYLVITIPDQAFASTGEVVGVDMGLNRPAVTSTNLFLGFRRWRGIDRRYFRFKRAFQAKGTRSAKRHLRRLSGKVNRFRRDCDHVLSRRIVDSVAPGTVIVVENLKHIRKRVKQRGRESRRRLHSWTFAQLRAFLEYKAEGKGCRVEGIDPRYTSQACSRCGHVHRYNRRSQSRFLCRNCGYELNADLNAARNIAKKYLAGDGKTVPGGLPSTSLSRQP